MSILDLKSVVKLFENGIELSDIEGKRYSLVLCFKRSDADDALLCVKKNLKDNHVKGLYENDPEDIDDDFCDKQVITKYKRNEYWHESAVKQLQESTENEKKSFYRLYFVVKDETEKIVGTCEIHQESKQVFQLGVFVDNQICQRGLGTAIVKSCLKFLKDYTDVTKVAWECYANNAASNKLALKTGFEFKNTFPVRTDVDANRYELILLNA